MNLRLQATALVMALCGTAALALIVNWALRQPKTHGKNLVRVEVGDLSNGHLRIIDTDALRFFVIHLEDRMHVVAVPLTDGVVPLPGPHWWQPALYCREFGVDAVAGAITKAARFRCHDGEHAKHLERWQWDVYGVHIPHADNPRFADLYRVQIERGGDEITLLGLKTD